MSARSEGNSSVEDGDDGDVSGSDTAKSYGTAVGSFDSGDSGVDPTRRASSPEPLDRAAIAPVRRQYQAYQPLKGSKRRHDHGSAKHTVMKDTGMRSASRSGTHFIVLSVIENAGSSRNAGFVIRVAA